MKCFKIGLFLLVSSSAFLPLNATEKPFAFGSVRFEENRGQTDPSVRYIARARGQRIFFTDRGVVLVPLDAPAVRMSFDGAAAARWSATGQQVDSISYYIGRDPAKWVKQAPVYDRLHWRGVYPGIDAVFYGRGDRLEYDLILAPHADPSRVLVRFSGSAAADNDGTIRIAAGQSVIRQRAPEIYQETESGKRLTVAGRFVAGASGVFRLEIGDYERSKPLVVDPVLEMASYIGGENDDEIVAAGDGFVAGNTRSVGFPSATPAIRRSRDVFVRGTGPVIPGPVPPATFLGTLIIGGSGDDELGGVARSTTPAQWGFLAGTTQSRDFPQSVAGSYHGGSSDGFVALVLSGSFTTSIGSVALIGGSGEDRVHAIAAVGTGYVAAGETDSPDLPAGEVPQPSLAGGKDAFYAYSSFGQTIYGYLGGAGDDSARAIATRGGTAWIGGETRSSDFPFPEPGLMGASDAFLAQVSFDGVPPNVRVQSAQHRIGGSGEDSIHAVTATLTSLSGAGIGAPIRAVNLDSVAFAGATSSADLPLRNPAQAQFGGERDAFAGVLGPAAREISLLTYLGGSGVDEATSVAMNWKGDLYVGGWTRSTDLPVVDALQSTNAGGEDGMFAFLESHGPLRFLTYYGGSGDDRIRALTLIWNYVARAAGSTGSSDLPQRTPWQDRAQGREGFVADIGVDLLAGPDELILAKDGAFTLSLRAAKTADRIPVTYRSADPSRVRFVFLGRSVDQATAPAEDNMLVEALSDSGEVEITASAEGLPAKTIRVKLYPGAFQPILPAGPLSTWTNINLLAAYRAIDPATGQPFGNFLSIRPGLPLPSVSWTSSDPAVFEVVNAASGPALRGVRPGQATLTVHVQGFQVAPSQSITLTAEAPQLAITGPFRVAKDFSRGLSFGFTFNGISLTSGFRGSVIARSEDPSRLLLSVAGAADTTGRGQVTINLADRFPGLVMHALAGSGDVRVILTSSEFAAEVPLTVNLEPAVLRWGAQRSELGRSFIDPFYRLFPGQAAEPALTFETESGDPAGTRRTGAPELIFTLSNSSPRVVELNRLTVSQGSFNERYRFSALSTGTAEISLAVSDPEIRLANPTVRVDVETFTNLQVSPASLVLGKDLQASLTLRSNAAAPGFVVASDDPGAVLISANVNEPGSAQVTLTGRSEETVFLQGLKATGETSVRVRTAGLEDREVKVRLLPSAAGFTGFESFVPSGFDRAARIGLWAYDPETGTAIQNQLLRPGVDVTANLRAEGANIRLSRDTVVLTAQVGPQSVGFTNPSAGEEAVLLLESPGFAPPPQVGRLDLRIPPQPVIFGPVTILELSQHEIRQFAFQSNQGRAEVAVTSLNPDLVLLSGTASSEPSATVRLPSTGGPSIFLHALAASGVAKVLVEAAGRTPVTITVALRPLRYSLEVAGVAQGATAAVRINANVSTLRPGVGPWRFTVRSRNPDIVTVQPETIELRSGSPNPSLVVTGVALGQSEIILEGPPDVFVLPGTVRVSAAGTGAFPILTVGKNLQSSVQLTLPAGLENPSGTILALTSTDPSRVVLSRSSATEGTATLSVAVPAGQRQSQTFYVQALAGEGEVILATPALNHPAAVVQLVPSWIGCSTPGNPFAVTVGGTAEVNCSARYPISFQGQTSFAPGQVRPAFAAASLEFTSSAPAVLAIAPGSYTLGDRTSLSIGARGVAPGDAILRVEQLQGFGPALDGSDAVSVRVNLPALFSPCGAELNLQKDTQVSCSYQVPAGTTITVTSKDPSLVLISRDPLVAGSATVNLEGSGQFVIQALAAYGTAEIVLSAPGYRNAVTAVALRPASVQVRPSSGGNNLVLRRGATGFLEVAMESGRTPRAGANTTFEFSAEPAGVISFNQTRVTLTPQRDRGSVEIRGVNTGPAVIRLTVPEGFVATGVPLAVSVIE